MNSRLPAGVHFDTGLDDIAHYDGFHLLHSDARALYGGAYRRSPS